MYVFLLMSALVVITQACPDDNTKKFLEQNLDTDDVCSLVNGKTLSEVWMRKKLGSKVSSIETTYTSNGHGFTAKVEMKGEKSATIDEEWKEKDVKGTFSMTGTGKSSDGKEFKPSQDVYFFFADEHVIGFYGCDVNNDIWRLVIAADKNKLNDPAVQQSLKSAEQKMNTIKAKLPGSDDDKEMIKKL